MGLLSKLFNRGVDKSSLIRNLVRLRVRNDPMAAAMGFGEEMADSLSSFQLAGLPEGTLVAIVETWSILHKRGAEDGDIFSRIEAYRSRIFPRGEMPTSLNLLNYIKYRNELPRSKLRGIKNGKIRNAASCGESTLVRLWRIEIEHSEGVLPSANRLLTVLLS